jgi:ferredoxin
VAVRLRVDPIMCDGFGFCAELAPELVELDEWGYPIVSDELLDRQHQEIAEGAVVACPRKALSLQVVESPSRRLRR